MTRIEQRGRDILEIFSEAQSVWWGSKSLAREGEFLLSIRRRKASDNANQHKRCQCNRAKRAARAEKKRAAYAARAAREGRTVQTRSKDPAVQLERKRARQRNWARKKAAA